MANFTVLSISFMCRVYLTSAIISFPASGLTVYAIAGDTYLEQVNSSSWRTQLVNQSQLLYICNRVAYHDLLNATRENGNLTISTDETAAAMSKSMNTFCKIMVSEIE